MRVLVTGATGFIGSNIARKLIELGHEVVATGQGGEQTLNGLKVALVDRGALLRDPQAMGHVDVVLHQAALNDTTLLDRDAMLKANVGFSLSIFERAVQNGCRSIVYASSTAVYGNGPAPYKEGQPLQPLNPYAESKKLLEEGATAFGTAHTDVTIVGLRYCNVYGPGESHKGKRASMIYQLAQQMKTGNPKIFRDGEQKRDYIYIKDVVAANLCALASKKSAIVNCGSGSATSFNDLVKILNATLGTSRSPEYLDNPYEGRYQTHTECDMTLAKEKLGFVPEFDIKKGIKNYFESGTL